MRRVSTKAADSPTPMPIRVIISPWRVTIRTTSLLVAPSAMRIPMSRMRCTTDMDMTPKMPIADRTRASTLKTVSRPLTTFVPAIASWM